MLNTMKKERRKKGLILLPSLNTFGMNICTYGPKDYKYDLQYLHSKKCGCIIEFSIQQLLLHPDVAKVAYYYMDYTQEDKIPNNGPNDTNPLEKIQHTNCGCPLK
jgi:hypothetical protein